MFPRHKRSPTGFGVIIVLASLSLATTGSALGADERKILKALQEKTQVDFVKTSLSDVVAYLKNQHGIPIIFDDMALGVAGVDKKSKVTRSVRGVSLRGALGLILNDFDLTAVLRHEVLVITTQKAAKSDRRGKIVLGGAVDKKTADRLRLVLEETVKIDFIETTLREGMEFLQDRYVVPIQFDYGALKKVGISSDALVTTSLANVSLSSAMWRILRDLGLTHVIGHEVVLITTPERAKRFGADGLARPKKGELSKREQRILAALKEKTFFEFRETSFPEAIRFLMELHGVPITIDRKAISDEKVSIESKITLSLRDVSLSSGLELLLEQYKLRYVVRCEMITITTPAGRFDPGDIVTVVEKTAPLVLKGREVARLPRGAKFEVVKIKKPWLAGYATIQGKRRPGWIHHKNVDMRPTAPVTGEKQHPGQ